MNLIDTRCAVRDAAVHAPGLRRIAGFAELARSAALRARPGATRFAALAAHLKAARLVYPFAQGSMMQRMLSRAIEDAPFDRVDWPRVFPGTGEAVVHNGIILKAPGDGERGVLLITFEDQWLRVLRHADLAALAHDYELVVCPTWSPPYDLAISALTALWPAKRIFILLSNFDDEQLYARFHPKLRPVRLLASSWVDPDLFAAAPAEKQFDVVMVANFSPYKRHFAFFAALARARARGRKLRVLLAGVPWQGYTETSLREMAERFGVGDQVVIRTNLGDAELRAAIRSARTAAIFSLIEGSCVSAAECLLLDVPLAMLANAHIGSKAFITPDTGRLLRPRSPDTAEDLVRFVDEAERFRPRAWMMENGNEFAGSTRKLDEVIRREVQSAGEPWKTGIVAHRHVRLRPHYKSGADRERLAHCYDTFRRDYGITLAGEPV